MEGIPTLKNILFMIYCTEYIIAQRRKGYPDQAFYEEYDFICHEKENCLSVQTPSALQETPLLHTE